MCKKTLQRITRYVRVCDFMELEAVGQIVGVLGFLGTVFGFLFKTYGKIRDYLNTQNNFQERLESKTVEMKDTMAGLKEDVAKIRESDMVQSEGLQCVLREQLLKNMEPCIINGKADDHTRENVEHMYVAYRALGGNGMIEAMYKQFGKLPPA